MASLNWYNFYDQMCVVGTHHKLLSRSLCRARERHSVSLGKEKSLEGLRHHLFTSNDQCKAVCLLRPDGKLRTSVDEILNAVVYYNDPEDTKSSITKKQGGTRRKPRRRRRKTPRKIKPQSGKASF